MYLVAFQRLVDRYSQDIGREALVRYWDGDDLLSGPVCGEKNPEGWAGVDQAVLESLIGRRHRLPFKRIFLNVSQETLTDSQAFERWLDRADQLKKNVSITAEVSARSAIAPGLLAGRISTLHFAGIDSLIEDLSPAAAPAFLSQAAWDMCKILWDPTTAQNGLRDLQQVAEWCARRALPVRIILENVEYYGDLARTEGIEIYGAQGFALERPVLFDHPRFEGSTKFLALEAV